MSRSVRCGYIRAGNVLGSDRSLPQIKKAMIDKHLKLIEQAKKKYKYFASKNCFTAHISAPSRTSAGTNLRNEFQTGPPPS